MALWQASLLTAHGGSRGRVRASEGIDPAVPDENPPQLKWVSRRQKARTKLWLWKVGFSRNFCSLRAKSISSSGHLVPEKSCPAIVLPQGYFRAVLPRIFMLSNLAERVWKVTGRLCVYDRYFPGWRDVAYALEPQFANLG